MDIMSIANMASQMKAAEFSMQYSVAVAKEAKSAQQMMGEGALKLIESANVNGDAAAKAQGKGTLVNLTA